MKNKNTITVDIDGVSLRGEFVHLMFNDMEVRLCEPFESYHTAGAHVPYFAVEILRYLDEDGELTINGSARSQDLLKELYWQTLKIRHEINRVNG